jgi:hypothetical protein
VLIIQPFATLYNFVVEHGNMSGWPTKSSNAQLEKQRRYLS